MGPVAPALSLAARLVLAATFGWAAVAKLRTLDALPAAVAGFGMPVRYARPVARVLPLTEGLLAAGLFSFVWSSVPAWIAVGVLAAFTAALVRAIPRHVPCPCFGASTTSPVTGRTVVRNAVLLALAVIATGSVGGAAGGATLLALAGFGALATLAVRAAP